MPPAEEADREQHNAYLREIQLGHAERSFFMQTLSPSPFHWHFQQAYDALASGLYLPGLSGLINGIEASLRTVCCQAAGKSLEGDLGRVMSNSLLKEAYGYGLHVEKLAFPDEDDFMDRMNGPKNNQVKLVGLRNDICHGNFQAYVQNVPEIGEFFTPECLRPVSALLLDISFDWALELSRFVVSQDWTDQSITPDKPRNPLAFWIDKPL